MSQEKNLVKSEEKIIRQKLSNKIVIELIKMIIIGDYSKGDVFPSERELMSRFKVGRPSIREALQYLYNVGFITISQGKRSTVQIPSFLNVISQIDITIKYLLLNSSKLLDHLKEVRLFFEVEMTYKAAELASPKSIKQIRNALNNQRKFLRKNASKFIKSDIEFHISIASATENPIFKAISEAMLNWLKMFHLKSLYWKNNEHITLKEHEQILFFIESKSPEKAAQTMKNHINRSCKAYLFKNGTNFINFQQAFQKINI